MEIHLINHGIASRVGNDVFVNKKLLSHPELYAIIIEHEKDHTSGYGLHDLKIDLTNRHLKGYRKKYYSFILKNPSSWTEFLPITFHKGKIFFNLNITLFYSVALVTGGLVGRWLLSLGVL